MQIEIGQKAIFIKNTMPNYWYYDGRCIGNLKKDRIYRQVCQKHKLYKKLENFNENLTELENMINHNFRVYYDTGNLKFVKIYK